MTRDDGKCREWCLRKKMYMTEKIFLTVHSVKEGVQQVSNSHNFVFPYLL